MVNEWTDFFFALFSHHGFEPETLCLRKIIAVFANVIEVHTKFLFHLATTTCSFFAIRNKCYSMLSMAFESIIVPFMKIQWTGTTETTTKTSPANENSRTNWCEVKLHAKSEMNAHKREKDAIGQILVENTVRLREIPENQERQLKRGQQINEWNII